MTHYFTEGWCDTKGRLGRKERESLLIAALRHTETCRKENYVDKGGWEIRRYSRNVRPAVNRLLDVAKTESRDHRCGVSKGMEQRAPIWRVGAKHLMRKSIGGIPKGQERAYPFEREKDAKKERECSPIREIPHQGNENRLTWQPNKTQGEALIVWWTMKEKRQYASNQPDWQERMGCAR